MKLEENVIMIPFWVVEVVMCFLMGTLLGIIKLSFRSVVLLACFIFIIALIGDLMLFPSYSMDFLVVGTVLACVYLVLGRAMLPR